MNLSQTPSIGRAESAQSFYPYELKHGLCADMRADEFPTQLHAWAGGKLELSPGATHFGFVYDGQPTINCASGKFLLRPGMYFSIPGDGSVEDVLGAGVVISRIGYNGFFQIGGPIEDQGRLRYIDGCTDSLLVPPVLLGDACLNLLYFPPGIMQTPHTHPTMRVGIVARGRGVCVTARETLPLAPGQLFVIPADGLHSFNTKDSPLVVIAYHPDSDFGPTHENHPMINRTIVNGESASKLRDIQTRTS